MKAYKMLQDDYRSLHGDEPPWTVGETRTLDGIPHRYKHGYHGCQRWQDVFLGHFIYGTVAAEVELDGEFDQDAQKICAQTCTVLRAIDVSRELRRFAADCAERALLRQRAAGHEPDPRSWQAIHVARAYAQGKVTAQELRVAYTAADAAAAATTAYAAAAAAAAATYAADAAADAATYAADAAAAAAADAAAAAADAAAAERRWQANHFTKMMLAAFTEKEKTNV